VSLADAVGTNTANVASVEKPINIINSGKGSETLKLGDRGVVKNYLMRKLPTLAIGANGSLILSVSAASKTDSTQGAINIINAAKGTSSAKGRPSSDGLAEVDNLPLRSVPMQVTLSTLGVPTAMLYQKFFIDFNTATTIDNIYNCSQIQHSISQGKFTTNWTFIYDNGYGRFTSPVNIGNLLIEKVSEKVDKAIADFESQLNARNAAAAEERKRNAEFGK
jgi:hypothetical protein